MKTAFNKFASLLLLIMMFFAVACSTTGIQDTTSGNVHHIVICWLKEPGNLQAKQQIIEVSKSFIDIPGVLSVNAGQVLHSDRPIVDSSFDVAIVITFTDKQSMTSYLKHPIHKNAVNEMLRPLTSKIVVYDFVD